MVPRDEDVLGFGVVDAEDEVLALAEVHGEGNIDGAGVQGADLRQDPHGAALGQEGDLVAFLHAQGNQAGTDAVGLVPGLFLGDFRPFSVDFLPEVYMVGELPGVFLDKVDDGRSFCHIHVVYKRKNPAVIRQGNRPKSSASILSVMYWKSSGLFSNLTLSTSTTRRRAL